MRETIKTFYRLSEKDRKLPVRHKPTEPVLHSDTTSFEPIIKSTSVYNYGNDSNIGNIDNVQEPTIKRRSGKLLAVCTALLILIIVPFASYSIWKNQAGNTQIQTDSSISSANLSEITSSADIDDSSEDTSSTPPLTYDGNRLVDCSHSAKTVEIKQGTVEIADDAFKYCGNLTSVTIPDSVTSIGDNAFYGCYSLESVTIPDSVTDIRQGAFGYCDNLSSVNIGKSVKTIGEGAFAYCDSLSSVTIGNSVKTVGDWAFEYCAALKSVTIPDSVKTIGDGAFYGCKGLTSIELPNSIKEINDSTFYYCYKVKEITIPKSVTHIYDFAFGECESLVDFYYTGSESQWNEMTRDKYWRSYYYTEPHDSTIHYNST